VRGSFGAAFAKSLWPVVECCDAQLTEEDKEAQERLESSLKLRDTWRRASKSAVESLQGVSRLCKWQLPGFVAVAD